MWCTVLWRTSRWNPEGRVRSGNSVKMSAGALLPMVFTLGNRGDAVWAGADKEVIPSRILLLRQSTKRLKLPSRSTRYLGHHETPREIPSKPEFEREGVPPVGWYGCTVVCEEIVAGALFRGNTQRS
jgi:hypothetical protein